MVLDTGKSLVPEFGDACKGADVFAVLLWRGGDFVEALLPELEALFPSFEALLPSPFAVLLHGGGELEGLGQGFVAGRECFKAFVYGHGGFPS